MRNRAEGYEKRLTNQLIDWDTSLWSPVCRSKWGIEQRVMKKRLTNQSIDRDTSLWSPVCRSKWGIEQRVMKKRLTNQSIDRDTSLWSPVHSESQCFLIQSVNTCRHSVNYMRPFIITHHACLSIFVPPQNAKSVCSCFASLEVFFSWNIFLRFCSPKSGRFHQYFPSQSSIEILGESTAVLCVEDGDKVIIEVCTAFSFSTISMWLTFFPSAFLDFHKLHCLCGFWFLTHFTLQNPPDHRRRHGYRGAYDCGDSLLGSSGWTWSLSRPKKHRQRVCLQFLLFFNRIRVFGCN